MAEQSTLISCRTALQSASDAIIAVLDGESDELDLLAISAQMQAVSDMLADALAPGEELRNELALLKTDLIARIRAMTRAVCVAKGDNADDTLNVIDQDSDTLAADELLRHYRRMCVRFRDTFPGNIRYLNSPGARHEDWSEFKSQ